MNDQTTAYIARLQRELRETHIECVKWRGLAFVGIAAATVMALWRLIEVVL
jgi:hypothetical protein